MEYGLDFRRSDGIRLVGFTDSDWAGSVADWKSTSRCCLSLGSAAVSWFSRKQKSIPLSSVEAEYMAASQASCEALWLRKLLVDLFDQEMRPTVIYCGNQSCIHLFENIVFHDSSKDIEIKYHFIHDYVQRGVIELQYISANDRVADILTNYLRRGNFIHFKDKLAVAKNNFLGKREC